MASGHEMGGQETGVHSEISLVTKKMYSHYNYEKGFLLCYKQNAGDFSFPSSTQSWGVEKGQVFPGTSGSNFTIKNALFKEQGMIKVKPENRA